MLSNEYNENNSRNASQFKIYVIIFRHKSDCLLAVFVALHFSTRFRPLPLIERTISLPCSRALRIKQAIIGLLISDGLSRRQIEVHRERRRCVCVWGGGVQGGLDRPNFKPHVFTSFFLCGSLYGDFSSPLELA